MRVYRFFRFHDISPSISTIFRRKSLVRRFHLIRSAFQGLGSFVPYKRVTLKISLILRVYYRIWRILTTPFIWHLCRSSQCSTFISLHLKDRSLPMIYLYRIDSLLVLSKSSAEFIQQPNTWPWLTIDERREIRDRWHRQTFRDRHSSGATTYEVYHRMRWECHKMGV